VRILLGEEVGFYHGKVMLKEAGTGGAWEWHQDYGYWYNNGFVFPRMMSAFVALDKATRENGCLQVLRGSHRLGRLEHQKIGTQTGVDPERIPSIEPLFERVYCEMDPGTVLFFDCNLLHASQANTSDHSRRSFILCYNALSNPRIETGVGRFTAPTEPCPTGPDDNILQFRAEAVR
jgi:ectoine hydroxylase-related dioxygenase (phytanoyl-CoA dioxygenase family)